MSRYILELLSTFRTSIWRFTDSKFIVPFSFANWHTPLALCGLIYCGSTRAVAVSASATAANGFPASGSGSSNDCLQQAAFPLAAATAAAIVSSFMNENSVNQFVHTSVHLHAQAANPALSGRAVPKNSKSKSSRTAMMFVLKRTTEYVPVYTSMYPYVLVHALSYTVMYCHVPW